jgi:CHAT domain-containing protein/tetratricopeptide (TPR) repeat protein
MREHKLSHNLQCTKLFGLAFVLLLAFQPTSGRVQRTDIRQLEPNQPHEQELSSAESGSYITERKRLRDRRELNTVVSHITAPAPEPSQQNESVDTTGRKGKERLGSALIQNKADDEATKKKKDQLIALIGEATALRDRMHVAISTEPFTEALDRAFRALEITRELKNIEFESLCLGVIGNIYQENKDYKEALEYYEKSLDRARAVAEDSYLAKIIKRQALRSIGTTYDKLDMDEEALKWLSQALATYQETEKEDDLKARILTNIGNTQRKLKMLPQAEESYLKARRIVEQLNKPLVLGGILLELGRFYFDQEGKQVEALRNFLEAEKLLAGSALMRGDQTTRIINLHFLTLAYTKLKDFERVSYYENQLKSLRENMSDTDDVSLRYLAIARELYDAGRPEEAAKVYLEALDYLDKRKGDKITSAKITVLRSLASLYALTGRQSEGEKYFNQVLELVKTLKDKAYLAELYEGIADGAANEKNFKKGADYYLRSVRVLMADDSNVGLTDFFVKGARVFNKLGKSQLELGEVSNALHHFRYSQAMRMVFGDKAELAENSHDLAVSFAQLDKKRLAIFFGKQAVKLKQEFRLSLKPLPVETQKSFLKGNRETYEQLIVLLLQERRVGEALQIINVYQRQEFFDFVGDKSKFNDELFFTEREKAEMDELQKAFLPLQKFRELYPGIEARGKVRQLTEEEKKGLQNFRTSLPTVFIELVDKLERVEKDFGGPPDDRDKAPTMPDVLEMRAALRELGTATGQKTAALYTFSTRDKFYLLLMTPEDEVRVFESPVKAADLNKKILEFYALLQSPTYDPRLVGKSLYEVVFRPAEAELRKQGIRTVMWMLDGGLRYVPVTALWDGKKYLVERFQNIVFTRADRAQMTRNVNRRWTGVGFGSSQAHTVVLPGGDKVNFFALPGVTQELRSIFHNGGKGSGVLNGEVFTDTEFTKDTFYESMKRRRPLVHVSSHFSFRPGDNTRSFMLLGDGTALTLNEMKERGGLFDGVELLTLSACNTAATQSDAHGKEIDGFAELAQRLGAGAVMATLWQVSDDSTPWLMKEFYTTRQRNGGTTKAEALRNAQLALLKGTADTKRFSVARTGGGTFNFRMVVVPDASKQTRTLTRADIIYVSQIDAPLFKHDDKKRFAHPYYWSPFVLFGNWR